MFALAPRPARAFPVDNRKPRTTPLIVHQDVSPEARAALNDATATFARIARALGSASAPPAIYGRARADIDALIAELQILRGAL